MAKLFETEYELMTDSERNGCCMSDLKARLGNHLDPRVSQIGLHEVTAGLAQECLADLSMPHRRHLPDLVLAE